MDPVRLTPEEGSFLLQMLDAANLRGLDTARVAVAVAEKLERAGHQISKQAPSPNGKLPAMPPLFPTKESK